MSHQLLRVSAKGKSLLSELRSDDGSEIAQSLEVSLGQILRRHLGC